ncbi:aldo/keto reductase [Nocardia sp. NPDC051030]|uniref:aldo/keto reductase n=1 Tax=Nocardia sp. NPDC051030 TaxID=3155162 RepID=UPI00341EE0FA
MTDLSQLVLGGAGYAGLFRAVDPFSAQATLDAAWTAGIRSFDTAPHYGAGSSEERLGRFLRGRSGFTVSTKVGRLLFDDPTAAEGAEGFYGTPKRSRRRDYSAAGTRMSVADSLARSGLDRFDTLLVHDPDDHMEQALAETVPELARLRSEGRCVRIGIGVNRVDVALRFVREAPIDVVLIAGRFTLLDRQAETELLPECARRGIRVLAAGVLNSGILADPDRLSTFDYRLAADEVIMRAQAMAKVCAKYEVPLRAAALQFPGRHPMIGGTVIGASSAAEVADTIAMLKVAVPEELWEELDRCL